MRGVSRVGVLALGTMALGFALAVSFVSGSESIAHAEPKTAAKAPKVDSVDALFAELRRSPGLYARFHEEKQIALLVAPITNDGTIHFDKAYGLARHTTAPSKQSVLLSSGTLTLWDGQKTQTIPLRSSASLRALAEAFGLMLAADRVGLERNFTLTFQAKPLGEWTLTLSPLNADLKRMITGIEIAGRDGSLKLLRVREASGDVSTTTFSDVDPNKSYSKDQAAAIFKVPTGP